MKNWIMWIIFVFGFIALIEFTASKAHSQSIDISQVTGSDLSTGFNGKVGLPIKTKNFFKSRPIVATIKWSAIYGLKQTECSRYLGGWALAITARQLRLCGRLVCGSR
jgi:hypothetical protein